MFALQKYIKKKKQELEIMHDKKKEIQTFQRGLPKNTVPIPQHFQQVPSGPSPAGLQ